MIIILSIQWFLDVVESLGIKPLFVDLFEITYYIFFKTLELLNLIKEVTTWPKWLLSNILFYYFN